MKIFLDTITTNYIESNQVVLDIESTGVDRNYSYIQAVGLLTRDKNHNFIQLLAEDKSQEKDLLIKLFEIINKKEIISFNGRYFDLPFIEARLKFHGLGQLELIDDFDAYLFLISSRYIIDYKEFSLRAMESSLGLKRYEKFELDYDINFYHDIKNEHASILVHNKYDVINTEKLIRYIKEIKDLRSFDYEVLGQIKNFYIEAMSLRNNLLKLRIKSSILDNDQRFESSHYMLDWKKESIRIYFQVIEGYIAQGKLGYVHVQKKEPFLTDKSSYGLPNNFLLIFHDKKFEIENIKDICQKILSEFLG